MYSIYWWSTSNVNFLKGEEMKLYGVYGTGGFGREVLPLAWNLLRAQEKDVFDLVFIDDNKKEKECNGYKILTKEEFLNSNHDSKCYSIAIASAKVREEISKNMKGAVPFNIHGNVILKPYTKIGAGFIFCEHTIAGPNVEIGRFFHANIYSYIAHDCTIGDYVTFAPRVCCNGNVTIGDGAYIGTCAMIKQGITIGEGATVGMGAVVVKDVEPFTTVVGNPAKVIK